MNWWSLTIRRGHKKIIVKIEKKLELKLELECGWSKLVGFSWATKSTWSPSQVWTRETWRFLFEANLLWSKLTNHIHCLLPSNQILQYQSKHCSEIYLFTKIDFRTYDFFGKKFITPPIFNKYTSFFRNIFLKYLSNLSLF